MGGICVNTLSEVCATVSVVVVTSECVVPESYDVDVRVGQLFDAGVCIVARVDVLWSDALARVAVADIGLSADANTDTWLIVIAVSDLITFPASLVKLLLFCWTAFCC